MIDIQLLRRLQKFIKISQVCKEADLNYSTIKTKLIKQTELNVKESQKISDILERNGIFINKKKAPIK